MLLIVAVYTASDILQPESGLFSVTLMGIILANQPYVKLKQIIEFKEVLSIMLVSSLFIILSSRLQMSDLMSLTAGSFLFLAALILFVRPAAVLLSTIGSPLNLRERIFLFWMAPRGIVAAAVASIFSLRLSDAGYEQAEMLIPVMFLVIMGTVLFYGLTSPSRPGS